MKAEAVSIAALASVAWWLCTRSGCRHVDEFGQSVLMLTWHKGRDRGWCPLCERFTKGWAAPEPQRIRLPRARPATDAEVAAARAHMQLHRPPKRRARGAE